MPRGHRLSLALVVAFYALVFLFTFHEADEDVWGRMAAGRLTLSLGHVPERDVFAYVETKPLWIDHEWLSGVIFYEAHRYFGGRGLLVLRAMLGVAAVALAFRAALATGPAPGTVSFLSIAVGPLLAQGFNSVLRSQAFTFLFFALFLYVLELEVNRFRLAGLVVSGALWANFHGGFVTGPLLIAAYGLERLWERRLRESIQLFGLAGLVFAASLANPYGVLYWSYLREALFLPRPEIVEWRPLDFGGLSDLHIKLAILLSLLLVLRRAPSRVAHLIALAGASVATLLHVRFAPFLGMVMMITLPRTWETVFEKARAVFPKRLSKSLVPLAAMLLAQALLLIGLAVFWYQRDFGLQLRVPADRYPVAAVERLKHERPGNLAIFFNWGEFAIYHLQGTHPVSIDGRYETVYPQEVVSANLRFSRGVEGSESLLETPPANYALYPASSGAARLLSRAAGWELVRRDDLAVLYRRNH